MNDKRFSTDNRINTEKRNPFIGRKFEAKFLSNLFGLLKLIILLATQPAETY